MIPMRCYTCGMMLGHLQIPYEEKMKVIEATAKTSKKRQTLIKELIDELVDNDCCARCIYTPVNLINLIK